MTAMAAKADAQQTPDPRPGRLSLADRVVLAGLEGCARGLQLLPDTLVYRAAAAIGTVCWACMPARRRLVRDNLRRVVADLGQDASDGSLAPRVRSAFQHWVRAYAESAVAPRYRRVDLLRVVALENAEIVAASTGPAVPGRGRIFVGFHFGAVELAALYASRTGKVPVAGPMEQVGNPALAAYFERTRRRLGIGILPLDDAARALSTRLARGEAVALVADRQIKGSGSRVELFGAPARLPLGPAVLAAESNADIYVVGMWRTGWGRWTARVDRIDVPEGVTRKERLKAVLEQETRLLERMVTKAPEQWWSLLFPIWEGSTQA